MIDIDGTTSLLTPPPSLPAANASAVPPLSLPSASSSSQSSSNSNRIDAGDIDGDGVSHAYLRLPVFGEHKRAVSSVKFAPSRYTKPGGALVASASASAFLKLWDLNEETILQNSHWSDDNDDDSDSEGGNGDPTAEAAGTDTTTTTTTIAANDPHESNPPKKKKRKKNSQNHSKLHRAPAADVALECSQLFSGHARGINDIAWNPVSPLLASASDDKTVRLWDALTGDALVEFRGHDNFVFCVDMHHALLASGSFDETVKLFDIRSGECVSTIPAHSDPVTAVSFTRDGTCIASSSHDGLIRIWDVATSECLKTIFASGNPPVAHVMYSPNGKFLLASTLDSCTRLWPVNKTVSQPAKTYRSPTLAVNTRFSVVSDFTVEGNIVTGSETGKPVIYNLQTRNVIQTLEGHTDAVLAVTAHDKLPLICSGGMTSDRRVHFYSKQKQNITLNKRHEEDNEKESNDVRKDPIDSDNEEEKERKEIP